VGDQNTTSKWVTCPGFAFAGIKPAGHAVTRYAKLYGRTGVCRWCCIDYARKCAADGSAVSGYIVAAVLDELDGTVKNYHDEMRDAGRDMAELQRDLDYERRYQD
jgi:hypothetical protein